MKFVLISDSHDAVTGMRLAGIEGVLVGDAQQAQDEIQKCVADENVGIVLVTQGVENSCAELIDSLKLEMSRPLVVTIPGSQGDEPQDNIMRYVREAIGIKI